MEAQGGNEEDGDDACSFASLQARGKAPALVVAFARGPSAAYPIPFNFSSSSSSSSPSSLSALLTPAALRGVTSLELLLPVTDSQALDSYQGGYLWDLRLRLELRAGTAFYVTTVQRIGDICKARCVSLCVCVLGVCWL